MGNPVSKIGEQIKHEEPTEGIVPSTPILTPKHRLPEDLDPRSPSTNIIRTPVQLMMNESIESTANCDTFNINSPALKLSDPRSPTDEFTRTPIVLDVLEKAPAKLHNKNLDNVRKTLINITPKKITDMHIYVPPRLLESSPLAAKPMSEKRKSFVGLLETNLDYVETDLDDVINKKMPVKANAAPIAIVKGENVDPRSPTLDFVRTPLQVAKKIGEIDSNDAEDAVPKIIQLTPKMTSKKDSSVKEFDKKITTLIFTDDDANITPKNAVPKDANRTPLADCNGGAKKVPKLKVSDRPRKSEYAVSKIPVFKDKKGAQCENIPPKRTAKWDSDNTLII